jgi:hypothetical protein
VRDVLIVIALGILALALVPFADVANPDYQEARDIADRINAVWEAIIHSGAVPEEAAAAAHLRVFTYEDDQPRTVLTHLLRAQVRARDPDDGRHPSRTGCRVHATTAGAVRQEWSLV